MTAPVLKLPLRIQAGDIIVDNEGHSIAAVECYSVESSDPPVIAKEIVRRCNCHDELVAALKANKDFLDGVESGPLRTEIYRQTQAALKRAEKGQL